MSENNRAHEQMQLLVDMIPFVSDNFALAGGTAINLFRRELPRYSGRHGPRVPSPVQG